jgi:outer membrane protein assembly factor BamB
VTNVATTICCGVAIGLSLLLPQAAPSVGQVGPTVPAPPASVPAYEVAWHKPIAAEGPLQLAIGTSHVFVADGRSRIAALSATDGHEAWSAPFPSDVRLAVGDGLVFVVSGGGLHALDEASGQVRWTAELGGPTKGPTWSKGFVVASVDAGFVAVRTADGSEVWRQHVGAAATHPVAIEQGRVFGALANRSLVVLDMLTGAIQRSMLLETDPGELVAAGDRLYFGGADAAVYSYRFDRDEQAWRFDVRVKTAGAPTVDAQCVYVALFDNTVRAFDRKTGNMRWSGRLRARPVAGPLLAGAQVVVPLTSGELILLQTKDGKPVRQPDAASAKGVQPPPSAVQAIVASADAASVYVVSVGDDEKRTLTARALARPLSSRARR